MLVQLDMVSPIYALRGGVNCFEFYMFTDLFDVTDGLGYGFSFFLGVFMGVCEWHGLGVVTVGLIYF